MNGSLAKLKTLPRGRSADGENTSQILDNSIANRINSPQYKGSPGCIISIPVPSVLGPAIVSGGLELDPQQTLALDEADRNEQNDDNGNEHA